MFYLPFDIGYKVFKFLPVKVACAAMKEVYRAKKVKSCSEKHKKGAFQILFPIRSYPNSE